MQTVTPWSLDKYTQHRNLCLQYNNIEHFSLDSLPTGFELLHINVLIFGEKQSEQNASCILLLWTKQQQHNLHCRAQH